MAGSTIVAVNTLTLMSTFYSSSIAFTVIFTAWRFLARAFSTWNKGRDSFEVAWVSIIGYLFGMVNVVLICRMILAWCANAITIADSPLGETFAIKFETTYFTALASGVFIILVNHFEFKGTRKCEFTYDLTIFLIKQLIKKIFLDLFLDALGLIDFPEDYLRPGRSTDDVSTSISFEIHVWYIITTGIQ